jgi:hypothetical protein
VCDGSGVRIPPGPWNFNFSVFQQYCDIGGATQLVRNCSATYRSY